LDQLILNLKKAYSISIVVVTHELASAFLIADRMVLLDRGKVIAEGTKQELRESAHPRVRQFLDRVPEAEVAEEVDSLDLLTGERLKE
jgi:phospholipid/cholesterol/gamma-HCH transport system ATP-binding protein